MAAPIPRDSQISWQGYRIRLYGQTTDDPQRFFKNLGVILRTDGDGARKIMRQAPVVIREMLDKQTGEALLATLRMIQALCLLEPMDRPDPEPASVNSLVIAALEAARTAAPGEESGSRRPSLKPTLKIAGAAVLAFLVALPFAPSWSGSDRAAQGSLPPRPQYIGRRPLTRTRALPRMRSANVLRTLFWKPTS